MRLHPVAPVVACLILATFSACSSPPPRSEGPVSLARAFETYETRRGSDSVETPRGTLVDYDSEILVRPDRGRLATVAALHGSSGPSDEVARLRGRISDVRQLLEPVLASIAEYEEESRSFFTNDFADGMVLQDDVRWRSFTEKQRDIVISLKGLVYAYVNATEYDGRWNWKASDFAEMGLTEAEVDEANDKVTARFARISPTGDTYVAAEVTRLVNEFSEILGERIADLERTVLEDARDATLEMEAALLRGKERVPVTITPYTLVEGVGRGDKSPRVGIPSQEDVELVQQEFEANAELADSINELIDLAGDEERLRELRDGLLDALETLARDLREGLEAGLQRLIDEPALAAIQADAEAVRDELRAILDAVRALRDSATGADPITLTNNAFAVIARIRDGGLTSKLEGLAGKFADLPEDLAPTVDELVDSTEELARTEAAQLVQALQSMPAAGSVANLYAALKKLAALADLRSFGGLEPGEITRTPFALDRAPDGVVDLAATPAESGDVLEVSYKLSVAQPPDAGQDQEPTEYRGASFHDVRKFGFYTTFSAQLLFFDRLHDDSSTFRAAPGISYNLHYRPEGAQEFHDLVAPGIGFSVSAPSFEDGTELAVGMQGTLFNDMIQAGYAYNISVSDDPWMFYFAFDLIAVFQAVK